MFRCSVFRNDAVPVFRVPVFRCSGVPGFTSSPIFVHARKYIAIHYNIFSVHKRLPVKHGTGNPGMEWGMEWNGIWNGITRNCKSRNL